MDSDQRRKRKRAARPYPYTQKNLSARTFILCLSFLVLLLFLSSDRFPIGASSFRPALNSSTLSFLSSSARYSILDPFDPKFLSSPIVQDRLFFPDHLLLMVADKVQLNRHLDCVYYKFFNGSSSSTEDNDSNIHVHVQTRPVLSMDDYDEFRSIVRCPLPPMNYTAATVELRQQGEAGVGFWSPRLNQTAHSWDKVVYDAVLDGDTVVVFVKGLNLRPHKISDPNQYSCHFGMENWDGEEGAVFNTRAVSAAQEVVRCSLPQSIRKNPEKARGIRITVGYDSANARTPVHVLMPSVARIHSYSSEAQKMRQNKYELCGCTMVWNQASALKEWVMYHARLGVQRWFIYDNNSDDGLDKLFQEHDLPGYNISRQTWPWIKTQEAGFSHCSLRARNECNWVGFFDVDEFFYLPNAVHENSLQSLIANVSFSKRIAEIRTACHSFGPSGLSSPPSKGVTVGYTCRLQSSERHKSIVRPDMLDVSLLNVVHHFQLKEGYMYLNLPESLAVINHYKYQVWETFKAKFFRRVATYVVDWQEDQNIGSKDRTPGLGTKAIEPPNWRLQFCEIWDTGLKDLVLSYFADPTTGLLPWESHFD